MSRYLYLKLFQLNLAAKFGRRTVLMNTFFRYLAAKSGRGKGPACVARSRANGKLQLVSNVPKPSKENPKRGRYSKLC